MNIRFNFIYFLISILLVSAVSANSIYIDKNFVRVHNWEETDTIKDDVLYVNMSLIIYVEKEILNVSKNFTITFYPQDIRDVISKNVNISVFNVTSTTTTIPWYSNKKYYETTIDVNSIPWDKTYNYKFINLNIAYKSPKFVKSDTIDKIIIIGTSCFTPYIGGGCPEADSGAIQKTIILPTDIALRNVYPPNVFFGNDTNMLIFDDFTPLNKNEEYQTKIINYTDLRKERLSKFGWMFLGIIIGLIAQILYDKYKTNKK